MGRSEQKITEGRSEAGGGGQIDRNLRNSF